MVRLVFDFGVYEGDVSAEGRRHGRGSLTYNNGNTYDGEWRDGAAEGFGVKLYKNGDLFNGSWKGGAREGAGEYRWVQGASYVGQYVGDKQSGRGIFSAQGTTYDGEWKNGKRHGHGIETSTRSGAEACEGNWRDGERHGAFVCRSVSGVVEQELWEGGVCLGRDKDNTVPTLPVPPAPAPAPSLAELEDLLATAGISQSLQQFTTRVTGNLEGAVSSLDALEAQLALLTEALGDLGPMEEEEEEEEI